MYSALKKAVLGAMVCSYAGKADASCDSWNMTSGAINTIVPSGKVFLPLSGAVFTSNNTGAPVSQASIYFNVNGTVPEFVDLSCPSAFDSSIDSYGNLVCTLENPTAEELTEKIQALETSLTNKVPFAASAFGYGDYTPSGNCPTTPLGSFVFSAKRAFEVEAAPEYS